MTAIESYRSYYCRLIDKGETPTTEQQSQLDIYRGYLRLLPREVKAIEFDQ